MEKPDEQWREWPHEGFGRDCHIAAAVIFVLTVGGLILVLWLDSP